MSQFDELPEGWEEARIGEAVKIIDYRGRTPPFSKDGIPHLRSSNIRKGEIIWEDIRYVTPETFEQFMTRGLPQKGDVLFTTEGPLGEVALAPDIQFSMAQRLMLLRAMPECLSPKFLLYQIASPDFQGKLKGSGTGTTVKGVSARNFKPLKIVLPPLNEQRRIVEKIEALTARSRKAREALEAIPELLDQFRQSVLAAAFRGDLTADWREQNPDVESAEAFTDFEKNEIGWAVGKAKDACSKVQSGSTPKGKPFTEAGEVPFLKVYNIVNQRISFDYKSQYVSREVHEKKLKRSITLPGDVLMNIVGPPLGKVALVTKQFPEWNINQAIVTFRPKKGLISEYLYYYLCEGCLVRDVVNETKGIVGQVNISLTQCRESIVRIPSIEEQAEIVRRIKGLFSLAVSLQQGFKESFEELGDLDQSILAKAFRGDLVPQDPNDEPASVLLDRIRTEREKLATTQKKRASRQKRADAD